MTPLESVLLAFADDELIIGHRHSEWTGWAPHIEEDIAFSSIAQDEIGHANLFYQLLSDLGSRTPDEYALARQPEEYTNAIICERPNRDWAYTLARHFLYEIAEKLRLEIFQETKHGPLSEVSVKLLREERYHQLHAEAWFHRLASGPIEGRHQYGIALSEAMNDAAGLFEPIEGEAEVVPVLSDELRRRWLDEVVKRTEEVGLQLDLAPEEDAEIVATSTGEMMEQQHSPPRRQDAAGLGGRQGRHSPEFHELWEDLTRTYREEPTATW